MREEKQGYDKRVTDVRQSNVRVIYRRECSGTGCLHIRSAPGKGEKAQMPRSVLGFV
jgi:hypothetical protein